MTTEIIFKKKKPGDKSGPQLRFSMPEKKAPGHDEGESAGHAGTTENRSRVHRKADPKTKMVGGH